MTEAVPIEHATGRALVRRAGEQDVGEVAIAVEELLLELGGKPSSPGALREAARELIADESLGVLLVAESPRSGIVGFLGVSWQAAIRIPGRYGLIQELWVHPAWRSREVGRELLDALVEVAQQSGISRIEVGLPSERFASLPATEAFYRANGFHEIGLRMKLALDEGGD